MSLWRRHKRGSLVFLCVTVVGASFPRSPLRPSVPRRVSRFAELGIMNRFKMKLILNCFSAMFDLKLIWNLELGLLTQKIVKSYYPGAQAAHKAATDGRTDRSGRREEGAAKQQSKANPLYELTAHQIHSITRIAPPSSTSTPSSAPSWSAWQWSQSTAWPPTQTREALDHKIIVPGSFIFGISPTFVLAVVKRSEIK